MVERFFRDIATEHLRSGVFPGVPELTTAIKQYIAVHKKKFQAFRPDRQGS